MKPAGTVPRGKTAHFCELKWQAWAVTFFSHSLGSADIDGLCTADPRKDHDAVLLREVTEINDEIRALAGVSGTSLGTGGMVTKLQAAEICLGCGCTMVIANGDNASALYDILDGKDVGTRFHAR